MTTPTTPATTTTPPVAAGRAVPPATATAPLESTQGRTEIADDVVAKIAGLAAREVHGVSGFGTSAARAFGAITERIAGGRSSATQGVSVEVGERQAAVDVTVVVEYGVAITDLARAIRRNVVAAVEQMTGLQVVEVNVAVVDLHLPGDDGDAAAPAPATGSTGRRVA